MFYWPYKLRRQTSYIIPRGPNFNRAPVIATTVNGTDISLKAPLNRSTSYLKPINPRKSLLLRDNDFKTFRIDEPGWEYFTLISRRWDFNGPWFTGRVGRLSLYANVMRRINHSQDVSFFHPRAFEATVSDLLTFHHAHETSRNKTVQDWLAPVDWEPLGGLGCIAARFYAATNTEVRRSERCRYLFLPISDRYLLQISIPITRVLPFINSSVKPEADTDAWISEEPMKALADQILDSLQVRLSPEAEQQQAKALKNLTFEERVLIKEFPPLKWI